MDMYFELYPDDKKIFEELRVLLKTKGEIKGVNGIIFSGTSLVDMAGLFIFGYKNWQEINGNLNYHYKKEGAEGVLKYIKGLVLPFIDYESAIINIIFNRIEGYCPKEKSLSLHYKKQLNRLKNRGYDHEKWLIGEEAIAHFGFKGKYIKLADEMVLKVNPINLLRIKTNLTKNPKLNFYLNSNEFDSFSPLNIYQESIDVLGKLVKYYISKGNGHEGIFKDDKVWEVVRKEAGVKVKRVLPKGEMKRLVETLNMLYASPSILKEGKAYFDKFYNYRLVKEALASFAKSPEFDTNETVRKLLKKYLPHHLSRFDEMNKVEIK